MAGSLYDHLSSARTIRDAVTDGAASAGAFFVRRFGRRSIERSFCRFDGIDCRSSWTRKLSIALWVSAVLPNSQLQRLVASSTTRRTREVRDARAFGLIA